MKKRTTFLRFAAMAALGVTISANAQTSAFTYQGKLVDDCCPATGLYDLTFKVFDNAGPGASGEQGTMVALTGVPVTNGLFTVSLDFGGSVFTGARRWLQIDVRTNNATPPASFVTLTPRTELAPTPYALYAQKAGMVPDGAITPAMINSSGASAGQTLTFNGSSVGWGSGGGSSIWSLNGANAYYNVGNVGIGTANPQELLQVGSDSIRGVVRVQGSTSRSPVVQLGDVQAGGREWNIYSGGAAPGYFSVADVTGHRFVIDTSGNVGIGTTTPTDTLDVNGGFRVTGASTATTGAGVEIDYNVVGPRIFAFNRDTSAFQDFGIGDFPRGKGVLVTAGGNVGIGTTSPEAKLHAVLTGDGQAVRGIHPASGVYGELATVNRTGTNDFRAAVYGYAPNDNAGYFVGNVHVTGNVGVIGDFSGSAFYARNDYGDFTAIAVEGSSRLGTGVSGTGSAIGVYGSSSRYGVKADNNSGTSALLATPTLAGEFFGNVSVHGTVTQTSDRNAKTNIVPVDVRAVLAKVAKMPVATWSFKAETDTRHIGPMAQDFQAAFGVGFDDRSICSVDADGVALAAIQGLDQLLQEKDTQIREQRTELDSLRERTAALEKSFATLTAQK